MSSSNQHTQFGKLMGERAVLVKLANDEYLLRSKSKKNKAKITDDNGYSPMLPALGIPLAGLAGYLLSKMRAINTAAAATNQVKVVAPGVANTLNMATNMLGTWGGTLGNWYKNQRIMEEINKLQSGAANTWSNIQKYAPKYLGSMGNKTKNTGITPINDIPLPKFKEPNNPNLSHLFDKYEKTVPSIQHNESINRLKDIPLPQSSKNRPGVLPERSDRYKPGVLPNLD